MQPTYPTIPSDGSVQIALPVSYAPTVYDTDAPASRSSFKFTDEDGDVFEAVVPEDDLIDLRVTDGDSGEVTTLEFYKADATKIIALIAEAAK